jgi:KilA domain-containing protein
MADTSLIIADVTILQDTHGRYSLNTLHKASGSRESKKPSNWLDLVGTKELIAELNAQRQEPAFDVVKGGNAAGTYVDELLAVSYAGWISPAFQLKVNQAFLASRREPVRMLPPITFDYLRDHRLFLEDLGVFDERDRLMLADISRTQLQRQAGLLPAGQTALPIPQGFDMEDAFRTLAPHLSASVIRKHTGQAGKAVAAEYRLRYQKNPPQTTRFVDGKNRPINWYPLEEAEWAYPILQSYLASHGLLPTTI